MCAVVPNHFAWLLMPVDGYRIDHDLKQIPCCIREKVQMPIVQRVSLQKVSFKGSLAGSKRAEGPSVWRFCKKPSWQVGYVATYVCQLILFKMPCLRDILALETSKNLCEYYQNGGM